MAVYQPNDGNYSFQWANYPPRSWASAAGADSDADADGNAMGSPPARTNPGHRGDCEAAEAVLPDGGGGADVDAYAVAGARADADADADLGGAVAADDGDGNSVAAMLVSLLRQLLRCVINETISGERKVWGRTITEIYSPGWRLLGCFNERGLSRLRRRACGCGGAGQGGYKRGCTELRFQAKAYILHGHRCGISKHLNKNGIIF